MKLDQEELNNDGGDSKQRFDGHFGDARVEVFANRLTSLASLHQVDHGDDERKERNEYQTNCTDKDDPPLFLLLIICRWKIFLD